MGTCSSLRRRMMMSGGEQESILPAGYTRLKYIYNTSNAYIDTGVALSSTDEVSFNYINVSSTSGDKALWGARDSSSLFCWTDRYGDATQTYFRWGGKSSRNYGIHNGSFVIRNNVIYWTNSAGGTGSWTSGAGTFQMSTSVWLFAYHGGSNTYPCKGVAMSYFIVKDKWHGIPCKDPNNVVGMYDIVNNVFHGSENSTAFIAGPNY